MCSFLPKQGKNKASLTRIQQELSSSSKFPTQLCCCLLLTTVAALPPRLIPSFSHIANSWWDFAVSAPPWYPPHEAVHASCHHCIAVLLFHIKAGVEWCNLEVKMFRSLAISDQGEYLDSWTSSQLLLDFVGPKGAEDCRWLSARLSACLGFFQMLSKPSETLLFQF